MEAENMASPVLGATLTDAADSGSMAATACGSRSATGSPPSSSRIELEAVCLGCWMEDILEVSVRDELNLDDNRMPLESSSIIAYSGESA